MDKVTGLKNVKARYTALKCSGSPVGIELLQYLNPTGENCTSISKASSVGIRHIAFKVENIEEDTEKLENHGAVLFSPIQTNPCGKKMVYLKGPDGIILELAEF
ncbi:MAG: VOC family protein [Spirochaetales bacterium]|nr:VOC family protein [Spirochaetales bacterium]